MISDMLADTAADIRKALKDDPAYGDAKTRSKIEALAVMMESLAEELDREPVLAKGGR